MEAILKQSLKKYQQLIHLLLNQLKAEAKKALTKIVLEESFGL